MFSLKNFRANLKPARPNLFIAYLDGAPDFGVDSDIKNTFSFRVEQAEFPGKTIATQDVVGAGTPIRLASEITYADITLTIICSDDFKERKYFENWMDEILGTPNTSSNRRPGRYGLLRYYNDYAKGKEMRIVQLNAKGDQIFTYKLHDIYPIAMSTMTASWEESNTYQRFTVTFNYRYHSFI